MAKSLKRGIVSVLIANIINLGFSLLSNFLLPRYLSVDTYAELKTFQLYALYAGLLHFGYVDGLYLKYGGNDISDINIHDLEDSLSTLRAFQLLITAVMIMVGIISKNAVMVAFGISILPANMMACFKYLYQAVGEFDIYSRVINGTTISYFILNIIYLFVVKTDNPIFYISVYIIVDIILWIVLEIKLHKKYSIPFKALYVKINQLKDNISTGILLTLGNFSSTFLTGMDRWFIKALLDNASFAQYSFAVSMENFMNVAVSPVSITMYNYFCRETDTLKFRKVRNAVQIFAAFLISCAFPAKYILERFIPKYTDSTSVMFYLFGAQLFYIIIKCIYVNLYKAQKRQKQYFSRIVIVIVIGAILNASFYLVYKGKEAFAVGTLVSAMIWWILCSIDHKELVYNLKEIIYLILIEIAYLICGIRLSTLLGFFVYLALTSFISFVLLRKDLSFLLSTGKSTIIGFVGSRKHHNI